jgi:exonuclease III
MVNKACTLKTDTNTNLTKQIHSKNLFKIFHQNIRGLKSKVDELSNSLSPDYPHIMCLTEHHSKDYEIDNLPIDHYKLGSKYCRIKYKNGGVCIFTHEDLEFSTIPLDKYCIEKDIEVCAVKLNINSTKLIILAIYRSPSGNYNNFLKNLDNVLNTWYSNKFEFVICGDINVNYLENCKKRSQLDALLQTYNLTGTVTFPTRKTNVSTSAIDNIFIGRTKKYTMYPFTNGLSDHEAQILVIDNIVLPKHRNNIITKRDINDQSILEFISLLSHENWEEIFREDDVNISFNKFLNIYLRIFHSCFIKKRKNSNTISKPWLTKGIKISCNRKRELYLKAKDSKEIKHKLYYKHYCTILSKVIKEAKKLHYKDAITNSKNKMKTTWNIINKEKGNLTSENKIKSLRIINHTVHNQISIANELNKHFLNITESTNNCSKRNDGKKEDATPLQNLFKYFNL